MSREAFENWARDNGIRYQSKYSTGEYYFSDADLAWKAWQAAQAQSGQPIAAVAGWYDGRCVIEPLDRALAIPVGMALYSQPQARAVNQQLPAARVWNQAEGRDGKLYAHGWNDCLAAIAAAQETALQPAPPPAAVNQQLLEALQHIMKMQTFGYIVLGEEATTKARAAIAAAQEQSK